MRKGLLIVIDGIDGSGKTTQIKLIASSLKKQKIPYAVISFPRYKDNLYGKLIKRYLEGEFGDIGEVNPYFTALAYAGDRLLAKPEIEKWLLEGKIVIVNRYTCSNKSHMGAFLSSDKRQKFFDWLDDLEYKTNRMPKANLTIILKVDPKIGQKNVVGRSIDIHEENLHHLEQAGSIYLSLAKTENNWYVVDCMKGEGMKSPTEIYQKIMQLIKLPQ